MNSEFFQSDDALARSLAAPRAASTFFVKRGAILFAKKRNKNTVSRNLNTFSPRNTSLFFPAFCLISDKCWPHSI